jgi:hypothetical protein
MLLRDASDRKVGGSKTEKGATTVRALSMFDSSVPRPFATHVLSNPDPFAVRSTHAAIRTPDHAERIAAMPPAPLPFA